MHGSHSRSDALRRGAGGHVAGIATTPAKSGFLSPLRPLRAQTASNKEHVARGTRLPSRDPKLRLSFRVDNSSEEGEGAGLGRKTALNDPRPDFREKNSRGNSVPPSHAGMGWCCGCLEWHPLDAFRPSEKFDRRGGVGGYCREYRSAAVRRWRERNREAVMEYNAQRRLGPRRRQCVDCGASFLAGSRGPASCRCAECRRLRKIQQRRAVNRALARTNEGT
jgi:hypothetical protein